MATFSKEVISLAQESERKYGVPASVTLAQYALESGYGTSNLARTKNNYFGMRKAGGGWQIHKSMADSFDRHGQLLTSGRYAEATKDVTSVNSYIDAIAEIYAPSSDGNNNYAGTLKQIIKDNKLEQYDLGNTYYSMGEVINVTNLEQTGWFKNKTEGILKSVIMIVAMSFLIILAIVFFMSAFNLKIPTAKNTVEKAVENT